MNRPFTVAFKCLKELAELGMDFDRDDVIDGSLTIWLKDLEKIRSETSDEEFSDEEYTRAKILIERFWGVVI